VNYPTTRQVMVQQMQQPLHPAANGDHFLEKLRQHKNEIERWHQGAASRWEEEERRYQNPVTTMTSNGGTPRNLHKTVSDSRIIQNGVPGREQLVMMMGRGNGTVQQPPLTWRNPMMQMTSSMTNGEGLSTSRERERAVPIQVQLDEGRVLKIPVQNDWRSATLDRNGASGGYRTSPERNTNGYGSHHPQPHQRYQSSTLPRGFERQQQYAPSATPSAAASATPQWREQPLLRGGRPWSPVQQQQQIQPAAAPPPPPPPPPPAAGVRIPQQHQPKMQQPQPPPRPKSPYKAPEAIPQGFHEELLSKIPVKAKEWHERTTSPFRPKSPGPVGARPEPPQHRGANGYANGHEAVMTRSFPGYEERRERGTIVSRPESPAAKLFSGLEERWKQLKEENHRQNEERKEDGEDRDIERRRGERQMEWIERERREEEKKERQRREEDRERWEEERREKQRRDEEEEARRWREEEERRYREEERRGRRERSEPRGILRLRSESPTKRNSGRRVVFNDEDDVVFLSREGSSRGSPAPSGGSSSSSSGEVPPHVRSFDDTVGEVVTRWTALGKKIGGDVERATVEASSIFSSLRSFLWTAAGRAEATAAEFPVLLAPISGAMDKLSSWRESRRNTPHFNHVSAVAEGIPAIGWVTVVSGEGERERSGLGCRVR
ncbi:hypothetical protein PENTCL1PPCAC_27157, partial [Pristionchus entomophagus]